ncbi:hypothetical protein CHU95_19460 [Niveispirillum lacus]|uniref:Methyltransferase type 11 domain-containing protein n=1 Tax=Niveispirillum lacus TaxID=1981099 RepID=A0A255YQ63_9PROT|nr:methyltransferase domain-containing protein [Niveispirillum lacus]OYQ31348.1 hypothetical protein CHU95_19460 [Niveispirillum lacus]
MDEARRWTESADAWQHWAEGMASPADRINGPLLDLAGATPGQAVLDLAAGVGEPSISQADRLRGNGLVVASDLVPAMVNGLSRRAGAHPSPPLPVAADMQALPFASGSFDIVLCRFGLMFVPDTQAALREMRRVLRPGGAAVLAVWGPRLANSLFDRLGRRLTTDYGPAAERLLAPLFRFAEPTDLVAQAELSGFPLVSSQNLVLALSARADHAFWQPTLEMAFSPLVASLTPAQRAGLEDRIAADFAAETDAQDRIALAMSVHLLRLET